MQPTENVDSDILPASHPCARVGVPPNIKLTHETPTSINDDTMGTRATAARKKNPHEPTSSVSNNKNTVRLDSPRDVNNMVEFTKKIQAATKSVLYYPSNRAAMKPTRTRMRLDWLLTPKKWRPTPSTPIPKTQYAGRTRIKFRWKSSTVVSISLISTTRQHLSTWNNVKISHYCETSRPHSGKITDHEQHAHTHSRDNLWGKKTQEASRNKHSVAERRVTIPWHKKKNKDRAERDKFTRAINSHINRGGAPENGRSSRYFENELMTFATDLQATRPDHVHPRYSALQTHPTTPARMNEIEICAYLRTNAGRASFKRTYLLIVLSILILVWKT